MKGVSLGVARGEVLALIGPTGAGKSTLLRILGLLDKPSAGSVLFDGVDVTTSEKLRLQARRRMAAVLQKPVLFNTSVYENVVCGLKWRGTDGQKTKKEVNAILEMMELTGYAARPARTLSGGEAQRVVIARALVVRPELLLLDEPAANLDPLSAAKIEEVVWSIIRREKITVVMATHDMSQGQRLADRICVLMDGEIVQSGSAREVFTLPVNRRVAEFVGMENIVDGVVAAVNGGMVVVEVGGREIEAIGDFAAGERVLVCIRPEDITISLSRLSSSARNSLNGRVSWVAQDGPICRVGIDCGFPMVAMVTRKSAVELGLERGKEVFATFKVVSIHVIRHR
ncbi:MAG: ABC transporter ATP-binding protein [Dehalococcoidales bacterium]|nr:ABC transporter ATP-binding protein [Dehalococcoidales bacterium]